MRVHIISVGRIKETFLRDGISEYSKRLHPYLKLHITELAEEKRPPSASHGAESAAMEKEGKMILSAIPDGSYIVALDVLGKVFSSTELAGLFHDRELAGQNQIVFIIGGDLGLSAEVLDRSDLRLSLSKMTFTHPMARLVLIEQIYRVCRINSGEPYHK